MALSAFGDKSCEPQSAELRAVLGRSADRWDELIAQLETAFSPLALDWNFGGAKWGWILRLKQKKRTVLYLTPCKRYFIAGFALGQKAVDAARARATVGEISDALEKVYSRHRAVIRSLSGVYGASYAGDEGFRFDRFGLRVPTLFVSPYVEQGTVEQDLTQCAHSD